MFQHADHARGALHAQSLIYTTPDYRRSKFSQSQIISLRFIKPLGTEPKEITELFLAHPSQRYDIQEKIRVNPRVLTTVTIKIYAIFQLNRKLNDPESGHH